MATEKLNPPTIAEVHAEWAAHALRSIRNPIQIEEMRRAFFCGFGAALRAMSDAADAAATEDEGAEQIERWVREFEQFVGDLTNEHYGETPPRQ